MPVTRTEETNSQRDGEIYLRDSGISFDEQDDRAYEQARRSRSRRRGYISPPPSAPPPLPRESLSQQQPPRSPLVDRSYAELLAGFQRQQQTLTRLRAANEEHARTEERLSADLLAMTHRYLQAQATTDVLERRCKDAEGRANSLALQLEGVKDAREVVIGNFRRVSEESRSPRTWHGERDRMQQLPEESNEDKERENDRTDTATVSAGTVDSSEYVAVDLSSALNVRPEISPEDVLKLVRTINVQSLEVARACIASATFRAGVRMMQVDNKMVVDVTEGIGCILVQLLRSKDHSKNKATIELGLRALLSYHVSKLIEDWPFHAQYKRRSQENAKDYSEEPPASDEQEFSEAVENALRDIATILSLSGSPGQTSSLVRSHRNRIGSTLNALFKTAEGLANQIKGGRFDGPLPAEYSFLYARPGATFNKDLMQKHGSQQSMAIWKSAPKKPVQVLCTREVGLARLHRTPVTSSSLSRASSQSSRGSQASNTKEIEVLSRVVIAFESDLDK